MGNTPDQRENYAWSAKIGTPDQRTPDQLSLVQRKFVRLISVPTTLDSHQDGWSGAFFYGWSGVTDQELRFTLIRSVLSNKADQAWLIRSNLLRLIRSDWSGVKKRLISHKKCVLSDWSGVTDQEWLIRGDWSGVTDQEWLIRGDWSGVTDQGWLIRSDCSSVTDQAWLIRRNWSGVTVQA